MKNGKEGNNWKDMGDGQTPKEQTERKNPKSRNSREAGEGGGRARRRESIGGRGSMFRSDE